MYSLWDILPEIFDHAVVNDSYKVVQFKYFFSLQKWNCFPLDVSYLTVTSVHTSDLHFPHYACVHPILASKTICNATNHTCSPLKINFFIYFFFCDHKERLLWARCGLAVSVSSFYTVERKCSRVCRWCGTSICFLFEKGRRRNYFNPVISHSVPWMSALLNACEKVFS